MDNSTYDASSAAAMAAIGAVWIGILVVWVAIAVLFIWFYWRIFVRAGFSGALSLLNLVPGVGNLICILILAFGEWPIHQRTSAPPAQS